MDIAEPPSSTADESHAEPYAPITAVFARDPHTIGGKRQLEFLTFWKRPSCSHSMDSLT